MVLWSNKLGERWVKWSEGGFLTSQLLRAFGEPQTFQKQDWICKIPRLTWPGNMFFHWASYWNWSFLEPTLRESGLPGILGPLVWVLTLSPVPCAFLGLSAFPCPHHPGHIRGGPPLRSAVLSWLYLRRLRTFVSVSGSWPLLLPLVTYCYFKICHPSLIDFFFLLSQELLLTYFSHLESYFSKLETENLFDFSSLLYSLWYSISCVYQAFFFNVLFSFSFSSLPLSLLWGLS